ncbi:MAG: hypothetical protein ACREBC_33590 [Pyrinomonadaceae bacterium]
MKTKTITYILVGLFVVMLGSFTTRSLMQQREKESWQGWKERNTLKSISKRAKQQGRQQVIIPAPDFDYLDNSSDLDQVLFSYSLVLAEPIEERTYAVGDDGILTWYKFRILESLSRRPAAPCDGCPQTSAPHDLLPPNNDEFLVGKAGGSIFVDGVQLTMVDSHFPAFQKSRKYLLFVSLSPTGLARVAAGPSGVFSVNDDGSFEPITKDAHPIRSEMRARFNSSVIKVKHHFKG